jgi:phage terminase large subunit-like protein
MLDLSRRDWKERLLTGKSLLPDVVLPNAALAARAVAAFDKLRLADVDDTPTLSEAGGAWFREIVGMLFGALDPVTKERLIRELFLLVPKKNAKTTYGAEGLMLVALLLNERPRAPMALMAPVQETAEEAFDAIAGAIALDPVLDKLFHVRSHVKTIIHRQTKADLKIMTFDPDILTGKKFAYALVDELHVIAKNAKASKAIRQIRGGTLPFREGFLAFITTMPDDIPAGVMRAELQKARDVRDGKRQAKTLAVLYEFPREMQKSEAWRDPANWPLVNPNMNRSVTVQRLVELYDDAANAGEADVRGFASQHLNVEIGLALMTDSWAGASFWEAQGIEAGLTLDQLIARCDVATVGIDGGGLDDLLGLCILGRDRETGERLAWFRAWAHKIVLERRKEIAVQLQDFAAAGDLTIVEHLGEDVDALVDAIQKVQAAGLLERDETETEKDLIASIGVDPIRITAIMEEMIRAKIPRDAMIGISQGWRLAGAIDTTERWLADGSLLHAGSPFMAWIVGNAKVEARANSKIITKQVSGMAKIDPLMALFNAVSLMALLPEGAEEPAIQFL